MTSTPVTCSTLLSTSGALTGTFSNYANGDLVDIANECDGAVQDASGTLGYTSNSVTLTITGAGNAGGGSTGSPAPIEITAPSLPNYAQVGQSLQIDPGSWALETSFGYQSCTRATRIIAMRSPGRRQQRSRLRMRKLDFNLRPSVVAYGPGGYSDDGTNFTDPVVVPPVPVPPSSPVPQRPLNIGAPTISGTASVGGVLTAGNGTWTNSPTSFSYEWERCSPKSVNCTAISGAASQTYQLTSADAGSTIDVLVTAINAGGKGGPARSNATGVVSDATTSQVTPAAVLSAIHGLLTPTGKTASLSSVLLHHGYTFQLPCTCGWKTRGDLDQHGPAQRGDCREGHRHRRRNHDLKIVVRLTGAGSNDLRHYAHLRIKSSIRFTAGGMKPISESSSFTLSGRSSAHRAQTAASVDGRAMPRRGTTAFRLMQKLVGSNHQVSRLPTQLPRSVSRTG